MESEEKQLELLQRVIEEHLSALETEMAALRLREFVPTRDDLFYRLEDHLYTDEVFSDYVRQGRIRLRGSRAGKWISLDMHSPRDLKAMLQQLLKSTD